jgi:rhodanese-related sulfurtransferase
MTIATIDPQALHTQVAAGAKPVLVDVRAPGEYAALHVPGAILIPLDTLDAAAVPRDQGPIHLLCQGGTRAMIAAERLTAAGIACCVVTGGTKAWAAAGLPVVRGKGVIAIERQVRIGAGSLVLAGALLAYFVHPGFIALSGFVGAGLLFAGITDWCGMGLLLALAPWNRAPAVTPAATASCCGK